MFILLRNLVRVWSQPDFPYRSGSEPMPYLVHSMFWVGVFMPIGAIAFVVAKLLVGDAVLNGQEVTATELYSYGGAVPLAVACAGVALAYGIWAEHTYPRYLVMIVLTGAAVWSNIRMIQTHHISWEPIAAAIGAIGAIRYLTRNPNVVDYYSRRNRKRAANQHTVPHMREDADA
jgi:hypothetical protein